MNTIAGTPNGLANPNDASYFRATVTISTTMDILMGLGLFTTAMILPLDKIAILVVLAGWAAAK